MPGHKWKATQHAKFTATMRARRETKLSNPITLHHIPNDKSQPEQIVYHGALYRRVRSIKVIK